MAPKDKIKKHPKKDKFRLLTAQEIEDYMFEFCIRCKHKVSCKAQCQHSFFGRIQPINEQTVLDCKSGKWFKAKKEE